MRFLILLLILLTPGCGYGATYYVKSTGNDALDGLSDASAWATLSKVINVSKTPGFSPDDTIVLNKGDKWRETLQCWSNGSIGHPITYTSYGTGDNPIIDGSDIVTDWTNEGDSTFSNNIYNEPVQVWENNTRLTYKDYDNGENVDGVGQWGFNNTTKKIIIRCFGDAAPSTRLLEVGARNVGIWMSHNDGTSAKANNSYVVLDGIDFQKTAGTFSSGIGGSRMKDGSGDYLIYQIMISMGNNITVRNLTTRQCGGGRPYNSSEATLPTIWAANIEFWKSPFSQMYNVTAYDGHSVGLNMETLSNSGEYYILHDSIAYNISQMGLIFSGGECYNNTVYNCDKGLRIFSVYNDTYIYRNNLTNNSFGVWTYGAGSSNYTTSIYNNLFINCTNLSYIQTGSKRLNFYNNIFTDKSGSGNGLRLGSDGITINENITIKNNIFYMQDDNCIRKDTTQDTVVSDYNLFYRVDSGNITRWNGVNYTTLSSYQSASGQDLHSISSDPLLDSSYKPRRGSPVFNNGTSVGVYDDYYGKPRVGNPEIGAVEYLVEVSGDAVIRGNATIR